jgi:hypothetical protein
MKFHMKSISTTFQTAVVCFLALIAVLHGASAQQSNQPHPPTPSNPGTEVGRYQIVVSSEGERGAILFLLDTKEGNTWIYRPPSPQLVNGFWSDIPRVTYPPNYWQSAFTQLLQNPTNAPAKPSTPATPASR